MSRILCHIIYTSDDVKEKTTHKHFTIIYIGINYRNILLHKTKEDLIKLLGLYILHAFQKEQMVVVNTVSRSILFYCTKKITADITG